MKRISRPRTATLSKSIHHQLNMYALAAGAAGVGMLSFVQPAQARVIYTSADKWLPLNRYFSLDLNHDGIDDFRFFLRSHVWSTGFVRSLALDAQSENAVFGNLQGSHHVASALPRGRKVGPENPFFPNKNVLFLSGNNDAGSYVFGYWLNETKPAYLGLKFAIKGRIHYGWARVADIDHYEPPRAKLTGYAYETIPNKPIRTGETKGTDVVGTMEPASLGHLAAGAAAIPTWRNAGDSQ